VSELDPAETEGVSPIEPALGNLFRFGLIYVSVTLLMSVSHYLKLERQFL